MDKGDERNQTPDMAHFKHVETAEPFFETAERQSEKWTLLMCKASKIQFLPKLSGLTFFCGRGRKSTESRDDGSFQFFFEGENKK